MNELTIKENIKIEDMIYEIRGKQVMLDSDLASLYETETKRINEAIKRNIERFPERFCFRNAEEEYNFFEAANCDFKRWFKKRSYCFYRTRGCYACYSTKD